VRIRLYPSSITENYWIDAGRYLYRADDHEFFERFVRPGDTVVDVGANIGALTIQASSLIGPMGHVISIEAHPTTYKFLLGNLRLNHCGNVTSLNVAVGRESGTISFSNLRQDDMNSVAQSGIQVRMEPLDSLIPGMHVSLLKIDVEGYERFVLEGAMATLKRTAAVYFESWNHHFAAYGYRTADVIRLLNDAGFQVFRQDGTTWRPVDPGYGSERCENLLALRDQALLKRLGAT
jgi:FkbM family methyltransferase